MVFGGRLDEGKPDDKSLRFAGEGGSKPPRS
jgi:hypothetical protein